MARNALSLSTIIVDIGPSSFLVDLVPDSPHQPSSQTSPDGLVTHCTSAVRPPQRGDVVCLDVLALCFLESLGVRHEAVCALSALEADDE